MKVKELVVDFYGCNDIVDKEKELLKVCKEGANKVNATVLKTLTHSYDPIGVSVFLLLAESHIYIATWPEHNYVTINIFLCNDKMDPEEVLSVFKRKLNPNNTKKRVFTHEIKK